MTQEILEVFKQRILGGEWVEYTCDDVYNIDIRIEIK